MNYKSSVLAIGLLFLGSVAQAASPLTLAASNPAAPNVLNASFSALASGAEYSFVLAAGDVLDKLTVTATHISRSRNEHGGYQQTAGFDIYAVYLDGLAVGSDTAALPTSTKLGPTWWIKTDHDNWTFVPDQALAAGTHTIRIEGSSKLDGGFSGNLQITQGEIPSVPEPQSYALLLAGLGALGFVARRRAAA